MVARMHASDLDQIADHFDDCEQLLWAKLAEIRKAYGYAAAKDFGEQLRDSIETDIAHHTPRLDRIREQNGGELPLPVIVRLHRRRMQRRRK